MSESERSEVKKPEERPRRPGVFKVIQSILAGAFGVQSDRRREEDFSSGSPVTYIVAGIVFVLIFVVTIALVVQWVISTHS